MKHLINIPATSVWGDSASVAIAHPLTETMLSAGIKNVRVSIELVRPTSTTTVRAGYQYSDDGVSWGTMTGVGPSLSTEGVDMGSDGWESVTSGAKRFIRFGFLVLASAPVNVAFAGARIETRSY